MVLGAPRYPFRVPGRYKKLKFPLALNGVNVAFSGLDLPPDAVFIQRNMRVNKFKTSQGQRHIVNCQNFMCDL